MEKAVGYVRVSTLEQAQEGISLEAQQARIHAYAAYQGLELVGIVIESGVSAHKYALAQRPGGQKLLALLSGGEVRHVLAVKLDRLFRTAIDGLQNSQDWDRAGIALHLLDFGGQALHTGSSMGKFFFTVLAGVAEFERNQISERTSMALQHLKEQGVKLGRPVGSTSPSKESLQALNRARELKAQNLSLRSIASTLDQDGYPTARGKAWSAEAVRKLLARTEEAA